MGLDERHYNINTLNKLFAIAALVLLTAVGLLVFNDYSRKWKEYQTDFQNMEIEKTRVKIDGEATKLKTDPEYLKLQEEIQALKKSVPPGCAEKDLADGNKKAAKIDEQNEILKQQYRVTKAQFDAAKFHYEELAAHGHSNKGAQNTYKKLDQKARELNLAVEKNDNKLTANK